MNQADHLEKNKARMPPHDTRRPLKRPCTLLAALPLLFMSLSLASCGEGSQEELYEAPLVDLQQRRFTGPGQVAQGLGPEGRAVVFVVLESLDPNETIAYDPQWTFEISVKGPDGSPVAVDLEPAVPRSWSGDPGVRMIAGFDSIAKGTHLVSVTSPNCPTGKASMIILPIN
jgi:hypothetical protein